MIINYSSIFIIHNDIGTATVCNFEHPENVNEYIQTIVEELQSNKSVRQYTFEDPYMTAKENVISIISKTSAFLSVKDDDYRKVDFNRSLIDYIESQPARRLSCIEEEFNDTHKQIALIPKGVLVVAEVTSDDNIHKLLLAKADYEEFMEQESGDKKLGLPTKKKIYKAVSFEYTLDDETKEYIFEQISVCDTSNRDAKYWWKSFLELRELRSDEVNTAKAYNAIKTKVIGPLKKKSKSDYTNLYNFNLYYFSTKTQFDINEYIEHINHYEPTDPNLDKNDILKKLRDLPEREKFDPVFTKVPNSVSDRMKRLSVPLPNNLDLSIKGNVENLKTVVTAELDIEGRKFIKIISDSGYDYFKRQ